VFLVKPVCGLGFGVGGLGYGQREALT